MYYIVIQYRSKYTTFIEPYIINATFAAENVLVRIISLILIIRIIRNTFRQKAY